MAQLTEESKRQRKKEKRDYHSALTVAQCAYLISLSACLSHCLSSLFCILVAGVDGESLYNYLSRPPDPHPVLLPFRTLLSPGSSSTSVVTVDAGSTVTCTLLDAV